METKENSQLSIGEIVTNDFRAASVFKEAGIDFCCGGKKSLTEACREKNIDPASIETELQKLAGLPEDHAHNFKEWDLGFLCDYILNTHHKYVQKVMPELVFYTRKIADVHGEHHPELIATAQAFAQISNELEFHLEKEEEVLFPAIKDILRAKSPGAKATVISEITRMKEEHEFAGGEMDRINVMTQGYTLPEDACATYQVTFKLLKEFEDDLHVHVHLENNILYPKALAITE
jgi:regulator of cell morphogenesis and NO signaling